MSDDTNIQDGASSTEPVTEKIELSKAEYEQLKHKAESQSGSDRAAVKFKEELDKALKEKSELAERVTSLMSEDQLKAFELEQKQKENEAAQNQLKELLTWKEQQELKETKLKVLKELEVDDLSFLGLPGNNEAEFKEQVTLWKSKLDKQEEKTKTNLLNQSEPVKGSKEVKTEISRADFNKMSPDRQRKIALDPDTKII